MEKSCKSKLRPIVECSDDDIFISSSSSANEDGTSFNQNSLELNKCAQECKTSHSDSSIASLKSKMPIRQELHDQVFFQHSLETADACISRIMILISDSHMKLEEYQHHQSNHAAWGLPILVDKQLKGNLLKNVEVTKCKSCLRVSGKVDRNHCERRDKVNPFDFPSSSSESDVKRESTDDEEWSFFTNKKKDKLVYKNKKLNKAVSNDSIIRPKKESLVIKEEHNKENTEDSHFKDVKESVPDSSVTSRDILKKNKNHEELGRMENKLTESRMSEAESSEMERIFEGDDIICLKRPLDSNANETVLKKRKETSKRKPEIALCDGKARNRELSEKQRVTAVKYSSNKKVEYEEMKMSEPDPEETCSNSPDVTIIGDIECPMCNKPFSLEEVEVHAADCQGPACDTWSSRRLRKTR